MRRILILLLLIFLLITSSSCSQLTDSHINEEETYSVASIQIDSVTTKEDLISLYDGQVLVFKPQDGFAIMAFSREQNAFTTLVSSKNKKAFSIPEVSIEGSSSFEEGVRVWVGGVRVWVGGWDAWLKGDPSSTLPGENQGVWELINLPGAYGLGQNSGSGIKVAVIDTGIDLSHPVFEQGLAPASEWKDFVDDDAIPMEAIGAAYGHGTGVAGLIRQIAPNARILPIRVLDGEGIGDTDDVILAIDHAVSSGADIINLSLGSSINDKALLTMISYAINQGVLVISSAGNTARNNDLTYPAAYSTRNTIADMLLSIGSVDDDGSLSDFSAFGTKLFSTAPGEDLLSSFPDKRLAKFTGTSFAAPIWTGVLALAYSDLSENQRMQLDVDLASELVPGGTWEILDASQLMEHVATLKNISSIQE